ncbi:MAG: hypothetical protein JO345_29120 [Streptosporangiaceae bacterium]|nr:hypothetical protein [Streptosporangiaceae bacterium]
MHNPTRADLDRERQRLRGLRIVEDIQATARRTGRPPLDEDEQRTTLDSVTNLPTELISEVVSPPRAVGVAARQPWQHDFPFPIKDVVAMAAAARQRAAADARSAHRDPAPVARPPQRGR